VTTAFPVSQAVRERMAHASTTLEQKVRSGQSVLALACGHLREADGLVGEDLSRVVAVDQDPVSIARIRAVHGDAIATHEANVLSYLRAAARDGRPCNQSPKACTKAISRIVAGAPASAAA